MKSMIKRVMAFGLLLCMSMAFVSCNEEKKDEQETKRPLNEIELPNFDEDEMEGYFDSDERVIWYYVDSYYEDGEKQTIDEFAVVDTIYVLEDGNATLYHLDYEEFALKYLLGDLEEMTDSEIIELLDAHNQSDELRLKEIKKAEVAMGNIAAQQGTFDKVENTYVDGILVEQLVPYEEEKNDYFMYIQSMRQFDTELYKECSYVSETIYDKKAQAIGAQLTFSYKKALTIPVLVGFELKYDEDGILYIAYKDIDEDEKIDDGIREEHYGNGYGDDVYFIESKEVEDETFTLTESLDDVAVGDSYYEGFVVENTNEYTGNVYKSGWLLKRLEDVEK